MNMFVKFSKKMASWFINQGVILPNEKEAYEYAIYVTCIQTLPILFSIVYGLVTNSFEKIVIFLLSFFLLRKYAGGYHAKKVYACQISSLLIIMYGSRLADVISMNFFLMIILLVSLFGIWILSPIDSKNRRLDYDEICECRKKARIISSVLIFLILFIYIFRYEKISVCICEGIILTFVLQLAALINNKKGCL